MKFAGFKVHVMRLVRNGLEAALFEFAETSLQSPSSTQSRVRWTAFFHLA